MPFDLCYFFSFFLEWKQDVEDAAGTLCLQGDMHGGKIHMQMMTHQKENTLALDGIIEPSYQPWTP